MFYVSIPRFYISRCSYVKISKRLLGSYFRHDRRPKIGSVLFRYPPFVSEFRNLLFPSFPFFTRIYQTLEIVFELKLGLYIFVAKLYPRDGFFSSNGRNIMVWIKFINRIFQGLLVIRKFSYFTNDNFRDNLIFRKIKWKNFDKLF